jgi:Integrase core domain
MIDRAHDLPITKQAEALNISRGSVYYLPRPVPEADLAIMRRLDRLHLESMDITYIPMTRGFVYLAVVLDWFSRRVLSWRASITMEAAFCVEALEDAMARHGKAGDLQYRPGFAVHRPSLHRRAGFTSVVSRRGPALRTIRRATGRSPKPRMKRLSRRRRRSRNSEAENDALRAGAARSPALVNGHSLEPHPRAAQTKVIPVEPSRFDLGIRPRT